jgi:MFS family permease
MIMLPIGRNADNWGRKPLLLIGFGILPVRAVLYTLSDTSAWLIGVQLLDGVGAGIFGAITPLVLADLMRGTGRYNIAQGVVATGYRRFLERAGRGADRRLFRLYGCFW